MVPMKFGVKTGQGGYSYEELKDVWVAADELGFDSAWLYDHFFALGNKRAQCLEAWTTLAALAAATKRLRIGTMVTSASYRHPSLLAKMATTVDIVSGGRLIVGLGAGWYEEEYVAYGYSFPNNGTRVLQLKETLILLRRLWTEECVTFDGKYFSLQEAVSSPKPLQPNGPAIVVGITKGTRTLPMFAVRYADGFNTPTSFDNCKAIVTSVRENCERYGRKQDDLTMSWQGFALIGRSQNEIESTLEQGAKRLGMTISEFNQRARKQGWLIGDPDYCVRELQKWKEIGINHLILSFPNDIEVAPMELFMNRVAPKLK